MNDEGQPAEPQAVDAFPTEDQTTPENPATNHEETAPAPENPAHPVPDEDPEQHLGDVLQDPWKTGDKEWPSVEDDHADSETFRNAYEAEVANPSEPEETK